MVVVKGMFYCTYGRPQAKTWIFTVFVNSENISIDVIIFQCCVHILYFFLNFEYFYECMCAKILNLVKTGHRLMLIL